MNENIVPIEFSKIESLILGLFNTTRPDAYGTPVRDDMPIKRILFGDDLMWAIENSSFLDGLEAVGKSNHETGFYAADTVNTPQKTFNVPFTKKDTYYSNGLIFLKNVIVGQNGSWGVVVSDEMNGLLVMKNLTDYQKLQKYITDIDGDHAMQRMLDHWLDMKIRYKTYPPKTKWIREQFYHVYGEEQANKYLKDYPLL